MNKENLIKTAIFFYFIFIADEILAKTIDIKPFISYQQIRFSEKFRNSKTRESDEIYIPQFFLYPQALFQGELQNGNGLGIQIKYELNDLFAFSFQASRNVYGEYSYQVKKSTLDQLQFGMNYLLGKNELISFNTMFHLGLTKAQSDFYTKNFYFFTSSTGNPNSIVESRSAKSSYGLSGNFGFEMLFNISDSSQVGIKLVGLTTLIPAEQDYRYSITRTQSKLYLTGNEVSIGYLFRI